MKHRPFYLSFLIVLVCGGIAKAQDCSNDYWGSQTLYEPPTIIVTPTPAEYKPVFINYVGRNGAEHLLKDVSTSFVYSLLQKADSAHALKVDGNNLRKMLVLLDNVERPKLDKISFAGIEEQRGIGFRMLSTYGDVFVNRKCVTVSAIKQGRMTESAAALLSGVRHKLDEPGCDKTNYDDEDNLHAFAVAPSLIELMKNGDWKDDVDNIRDSKKPDNFNIKFLTRFFEQKFFDGIPEPDQNKFIADLYKLSTVINSIHREIINAGYTIAQLDIRSFFTCSELQLFNTLNSAEQFYKSGPGNDKAGIQVRAAVPLLINFLNTTDAYSVSSNVAADFRITNAETMASFVALMGIKGASKESNDVNKFEKVWKAEEVVPLSANLQWVLFKGTTPDTQRELLIKFIFNEKEVQIEGLKSSAELPYYKWDDVKAFYTKKLNDEWDVEKLDANMHEYLLNLK